MSKTAEKIGVGSTVKLVEPEKQDKSVEFTVVDQQESSPSEGRVSMEAPMARAVMGKREGDEVVVPTPRATRRYRIVSAS